MLNKYKKHILNITFRAEKASNISKGTTKKKEILKY